MGWKSDFPCRGVKGHVGCRQHACHGCVHVIWQDDRFQWVTVRRAVGGCRGGKCGRVRFDDVAVEKFTAFPHSSAGRRDGGLGLGGNSSVNGGGIEKGRRECRMESEVGRRERRSNGK